LGQLRIHRQRIQSAQQLLVQTVPLAADIRQAAAIEDRVALAPRAHQSGIGQHLEMMAHSGLAHVEDLGQFQHAEGVAAQYPQNIQPQRVAGGLEKGCQAGSRGAVGQYQRGALIHAGHSRCWGVGLQWLYQNILIYGCAEGPLVTYYRSPSGAGRVFIARCSGLGENAVLSLSGAAGFVRFALKSCKSQELFMPSRRDRANAIRALSMDAVQKANSGHPGAPMGMADIAEVLWRDFLKHNPANPQWADRDRFVLSNGHGSMLIYSLLHLTGYDLSIDDLKSFRQLHSKTPGHPELGYTPGVETTTGPLGQGIANAVGFALAEKIMAAQFNRPGHDIVDHETYVFLGDGCMMEGISHEACSLAGTLGLSKMTAFYDDNGISIDGEVHGWFTDDTPRRFESYGWQVIRNVDGHDADEIKTAIETARKSDKPTLICCKTIIGFGSPNKQGK